MLTVKELKEALNNVSDDTRVCLAGDSEGNYRWAEYADLDGVIIDDDYFPEIYSSEWSADEADMDADEWNEYLKKPKAFVISP